MTESHFLGEPYGEWLDLKQAIIDKGFKNVREYINYVKHEEFEVTKLKSKLEVANAKFHELRKILDDKG